MGLPAGKILAWLLLLAPAVAAAQAVIPIPAQQCVWRAGDDPAWAAPSLDESGWQPYPVWQLNAHQPHIWVRCKTHLSSLSAIAHPALQLDLRAAYQLFLDGEFVGASGNPASGVYSMDSIQTLPVAPDALHPGINQIAVRITYRAFVQSRPLALFAGDESTLRDHRDHEALAGALRYLPVAICYVVIGVVGFMLFGLYLSDRGRRELFYLAIVCWCVSILRIDDFCDHALVPMSNLTWDCLYGIGQLLFIPNLLFLFRLARKRIPWALWASFVLFTGYPFLLLLSPALSAATALQWWTTFSSAHLYAADVACALVVALAPFFAFWPWTSISRQMRPLAICCMVWGTADAIWLITVVASILSVAGAAFLAHWGVFLIELRAFAVTTALVALFALLFREQHRTSEERAALAGEMASAREIQQYLIPEKLSPTPGLAVHSVYHPAREVGGDFFQVLPDARDGSTLIVVGDVAGKGLQAGMLAALIVGSIRTAFQFTSEPGRILALLNERLQGRGLVTCLAMRIDSNGTAELANAGHLPPYINGRELILEGALPLGALPAASFPSTRLQLGEGETMLFVSDGVIEARNASGELFGFERTASIAGEPADSIARAAQSFGQEDDITVLTLARSPAR